MQSDILIARDAKMKLIYEMVKELGISDDDYEPYGKYKGKLNAKLLNTLIKRKISRLILVTAMNPTPTGEGKTTVT